LESGHHHIIRSGRFGLFPADLTAFLQSTLTLSQRGKRLMELDQKWSQMNLADDEESDSADEL